MMERSLFFPVFCISDCGIEIVDQWSHLGHVISSKVDDLRDILRCRNRSIICYVHFDKLNSFMRNRLFKDTALLTLL